MPGAEVSTEMTERDAEADNGVVQLKVWSEDEIKLYEKLKNLSTDDVRKNLRNEC